MAHSMKVSSTRQKSQVYRLSISIFAETKTFYISRLALKGLG